MTLHRRQNTTPSEPRWTAKTRSKTLPLSKAIALMCAATVTMGLTWRKARSSQETTSRCFRREIMDRSTSKILSEILVLHLALIQGLNLLLVNKTISKTSCLKANRPTGTPKAIQMTNNRKSWSATKTSSKPEKAATSMSKKSRTKSWSTTGPMPRPNRTMKWR